MSTHTCLGPYKKSGTNHAHTPPVADNSTGGVGGGGGERGGRGQKPKRGFRNRSGRRPAPEPVSNRNLSNPDNLEDPTVFRHTGGRLALGPLGRLQNSEWAPLVPLCGSEWALRGALGAQFEKWAPRMVPFFSWFGPPFWKVEK